MNAATVTMARAALDALGIGQSPLREVVDYLSTPPADDVREALVVAHEELPTTGPQRLCTCGFKTSPWGDINANWEAHLITDAQVEPSAEERVSTFSALPKKYVRTRDGFQYIKDTRNGFPIGQYAPEKRPGFYAICGVVECYWESGTHRLEAVTSDLIEHYEETHLSADGSVQLAKNKPDYDAALEAAFEVRPHGTVTDAERPYSEAVDVEHGAWETDDIEERAHDLLAVVAHRRAEAAREVRP